MNNDEIIRRATVSDNMGTKPDYVELSTVRHYSRELADKIQEERDAEASRDPFEGTPFASPELYA